jgi:hypothetical protein
MITGFFFYLTAFFTVLMMVTSWFLLNSIVKEETRTGEDVVWFLSALATFSASLVFFIWGLIL